MDVDDPLAFWITGFQQSALQPASLGTAAEGDAPHVIIQTLYSGVSRGTESLVYNNLVPENEYQRMRAPFQEGEFPFPVKYGYANVGEIVEGPDALSGRPVFCLYPHQQRYAVPASAVLPLPADVPPARAVLAANMETAVNGVWDGQPTVGDRVAVIGLGVVGLLVAWLVNRIPGVELVAVDTNESRRPVAEALGLTFSREPEPGQCDVVFHASGHSAGLAQALSLAGPDARVVELSWYGDAPASVPLGHAFHPNRLTLRSSQVGHLSPERRPRWDHRRRLQLALSLLSEPALDVLISGESRFEELPRLARTILAPGADALCHRIVY